MAKDGDTDTVLVIGGTGPTGPFIVHGLLARGVRVVICHTGRHEIDEIPAEVEHIHTDPFDAAALRTSLVGRRFGAVIATYGRLRDVAVLARDLTDRLITVGGMPAYRGYMVPEVCVPPGLPIPAREDGALAGEGDDPKSVRVAESERRLFREFPEATHLRYPYVYGPRQLTPREWPIVRRIRDGRSFVIVPDGGLLLHTYGYVENLAHAVLCAFDRPDASRGEVFNAADETMLTLGDTINALGDALGHRLEQVLMPKALASPALALVRQSIPTHRIVTVDKLRDRLGYRDVVHPLDALARTAEWLMQNPPSPEVEGRMGDPFDYAAEDRLVSWWREVLASRPVLEWRGEAPDTGYGNFAPGTKHARHAGHI
jgi:nucleoside-diphosphate-sugar epimerase